MYLIRLSLLNLVSTAALLSISTYRGVILMSARIVGFIGEKGGVGKTTACYHIAIALVRAHNKRVLVLDTDYQRGGITGRLLPERLESFRKGEAPGTTLYHVFQSLYGGLKSIPVPTVVPTDSDVDLIASDPRLAGTTVDRMPGGPMVRDNARKQIAHLSAIAEAIAHYTKDYDYILIDTHPEVSDLMRSVIYACDYCITPTKLDEQSAVGVPTMLESIRAVNEEVRILTTLLDMKTEYRDTEHRGTIGMMTREYREELIMSAQTQYSTLNRLGAGMFQNYSTDGDGIRTAAELRVPVYDVIGPNAEKQASQFAMITREFIRRCP